MYFVEKRVPFDTADEMRVALRDAIMTEKARRHWCDDTDQILTRCGLPSYLAPQRHEVELVLRRYQDLVCRYHHCHSDDWHIPVDHGDRTACRVTDIERDIRQGRRIFVPAQHANPSDYYRNGGQVSPLAPGVYITADPTRYVQLQQYPPAAMGYPPEPGSPR